MFERHRIGHRYMQGMTESANFPIGYKKLMLETSDVRSGRLYTASEAIPQNKGIDRNQGIGLTQTIRAISGVQFLDDSWENDGVRNTALTQLLQSLRQCVKKIKLHIKQD